MQTEEERAAWLLEREEFVTASDVAAVMGLSPHKSRKQVFNAKVHRTPGPDIDRLPMVMAGKHFEAGVLSWHLAHRGFDGELWAEHIAALEHSVTQPEYFSRITPSGLVKHPTCEALAATPDAIVVTPGNGKVWGTEIKYVDRDKHASDWAHTWKSGQSTTIPDARVVHCMKYQKIDEDALRAPVYYWTQLQAQLSCLRLEHGRIIVAFGQARADLDYHLDTSFESRMLLELSKFWAEVEAARELLS
jgi:hypothetical protein